MIFDCIVIGKGLIGSAAAKYLSDAQKNVAIIGPDEHTDVNKAVVFSSHYDQGRVQRIIGVDEVWTLLNLQSVRQYNFLEKESGISFHSKVGCLYVNPSGTDNYLEQIKNQAYQFGPTYNFFKSAEAIRNVFPDFDFPASSMGIFEGAPSGYINPRMLIKAQLNLFRKNKGIVINDVANDINHERNYFQITTLSKIVYRARNVLLCPGAFINFFNLIKDKLALTLKSETTIWANVDTAEANRLSNLPSLLYEINIPEYKNVYLIQPVKYPDGKYYLKMGCNLPEDIYFDNIQDVQNWFRKGSGDANSAKLNEALLKIIPRLRAKEYFTKRCIVSFTMHHKPYVGALNDKGLFVACGGNGYSAMCSDALGRIAASLVAEGVFPNGYSPESFQPIFINNKKEKAVSD